MYVLVFPRKWLYLRKIFLAQAYRWIYNVCANIYTKPGDLEFFILCDTIGVIQGFIWSRINKKEKTMTYAARLRIILFCIILFSCTNVFAQYMNTLVKESEFPKMDVNKDGFATYEEMLTYQEQRFNELDKDKNGVLDSSELKADQTKMFERADKDKNGKITRQEATSQFNEYFNGMDADKNGKVSEKEYKEYWPVVMKF